MLETKHKYYGCSLISITEDMLLREGRQRDTNSDIKPQPTTEWDKMDKLVDIYVLIK